MDEENNDEATIKCCLSQATSQLKIELQYILKQVTTYSFIFHQTMRVMWSFIGDRGLLLIALVYIPEPSLLPVFRVNTNNTSGIGALQSENKVDKNDEHFDVGLDDDGLVEDVDLRYRIIHPSQYFRHQLPRTLKFPVPTQAGMFTGITAYVSAVGNL